MKNYGSWSKNYCLKKTDTYTTYWNIMQNLIEIRLCMAQFYISTQLLIHFFTYFVDVF